MARSFCASPCHTSIASRRRTYFSVLYSGDCVLFFSVNSPARPPIPRLPIDGTPPCYLASVCSHMKRLPQRLPSLWSAYPERDLLLTSAPFSRPRATNTNPNALSKKHNHSEEDTFMNPQVQHSTKTRRMHAKHSTPVTFTGNEKHLITLDDATRLTENYRRTVPDGNTLGGSFSQQIIDKLLRQQICVGIRIYFGSQDDGAPTFVLVGVNSNNNDLFSGVLGTHPSMSPASLIDHLTEADLPQANQGDPLSYINHISLGLENHITTLAEASRLTRNFRESAQGSMIKGGFFSKNIFNKILGQPGCVGIHIYFAEHGDRRQTLVLAGNDVIGCHFAKWPFGDEVYPCPPFCAPSNPLNC